MFDDDEYFESEFDWTDNIPSASEEYAQKKWEQRYNDICSAVRLVFFIGETNKGIRIIRNENVDFEI